MPQGLSGIFQWVLPGIHEEVSSEISLGFSSWIVLTVISEIVLAVVLKIHPRVPRESLKQMNPKDLKEKPLGLFF